jgi:hypothetical protein
LFAALRWSLAFGLGGLLVYAGFAKLGDPAGFATEIANYRVFPGAAPYLATVLPAVEIVLGGALLLFVRGGPWLQGAALATSGLMTVFTVAVGLVLVRGINLECGCFGGDAGPVTALTLGRDLALVAGAGALIALGRRRAQR